MDKKASIKPDIVKIAQTQRHLYLLQKIKEAKQLTVTEINELKRFETQTGKVNAKGSKPAKLLEKREMFCREYLIDLNATQAAIRSGYSPKTAKSQGQRLLTKADVQERLQELRLKRMEKVEISADRVLDELSKMAFADISTMLNVSENGTVSLKTIDKLSPEQTAAIQEVSEYETDRGLRRFRFKMHDKLKALELIARHLGMLTDNITIKELPKVNIILNGGK